MKPLVSMWSAVSDRDYADQREPREPEPRPEPIRVCRCGTRMDKGSAIGHLSIMPVCLECAKVESAQYLRRVAERSTKRSA